jgi:hypothetical protein
MLKKGGDGQNLLNEPVLIRIIESGQDTTWAYRQNQSDAGLKTVYSVL